jgi:hypothetical protein
MIIYAILNNQCPICSIVNKYLYFLSFKFNNLQYIKYYPSIKYIYENYKDSHADLLLKFPKIYLLNDNKCIDITNNIIKDSIKFTNSFEKINYKDITFNKFVNIISPLKQ